MVSDVLGGRTASHSQDLRRGNAGTPCQRPGFCLNPSCDLEGPCKQVTGPTPPKECNLQPTCPLPGLKDSPSGCSRRA